MELSLQDMCNETNPLAVAGLLNKIPGPHKELKWLEKQRWGKRPICVKCGRMRYVRMRRKSIRLFRCSSCGCEFTVRTGTVMARSHTPPHKWLLGACLMYDSCQSISASGFAEAVGVTYSTAWSMMHKVRHASRALHDIFHVGDYVSKAVRQITSRKLEGIVEIDAAYLGGLEKNKHADKRRRWGRGPCGKIPILGMRERQTGRFIPMAIRETSRETVQGLIRKNVKPGTTIITDEHGAYEGLEKLGYKHDVVKHNKEEYVKDDDIHTNGIESMWRIKKDLFKSTHHWFCAKHAQKYVDGLAYRINVWNKAVSKVDKLKTFAVSLFSAGPRSYRSIVL